MKPLARDATRPEPSLVIDDTILEFLPTPVCVCSADGTVVRYNRKATQLWGCSPRPGDANERFCGSHRLFRPDGLPLPHADCPMAEVLRTGIPARDLEVIIEQPCGTRLWVLVNIEPIRNGRGEVSGGINSFQDITARKALELQLRRSQQDLEDFFENGAVGLHLVGADGTILRANKAELALLGYSAEEYVGRKISEFHVDPEVIADILKRLLRGERLDRVPARLRAKDGSIRHVLITSSGHFRDGKFKNTRCFTVDITGQALADAALHESRRRLAATYEAVPVGIAETDGNGRFLRVNRAFSAISGLSPDELRDRTFLDLTHPDDRETDAKRYARQARGEIEQYAIRKRYVRPDGGVIFVDVLSSSVRDGQGCFRYGVRVVQDVTERQRMQALLSESERRTRNLLEALPVAVYTTDAAGRITYYNKAAANFAGRRPALGEQWCVTWRLYRPDGSPLPHDQCPMAVALKEDRPVWGMEAVAERPDGTRIPFLPYPTPLHDAAGALVGAVNVLVDISEHKRAEEAVQRLASIVESSHDAIVSKDLDGIIKTWNKGAERLFGYTAAEVIGKPITLLIPPERHDEESMILARIRRGERLSQYETVRVRKDGTSIDISLTVSPVRGADGRIIGASKIARDITERKRAEMRRQLLVNELNHRVKNTLAVVQSVAAQSFRGETDGHAYARFEARLMALARAHDILTREDWESADLRDLVTRTVAPHCADASRFELNGAPLRISASMALSLTMALHELCTNAAKYGALSNATGRVHIGWHVTDGSGGRRLHLRWAERGGPAVLPPRSRGFGSRLIERGLARELDADVRLDYAPSGVICTIGAPLR
ncbi:PAS domain S-box protein [Microvirga massiliensis]|uniref:PAS domain S-box protein n=1 Tax=Microvirga massiliensis TaxID=1033741 RepID=UPI00093B433B|nr:PAS domain S-box protein [Microvirga massiliensis]